MAADTQTIIDSADKLGLLLSEHPTVERFRQAQKTVAEDPDASRLFAEFDRQIETLGRQEQSGMPLTDAQRTQLESLQARIVSHIKIKALNLAQVEFVDLLRKVSQAVHKPLQDVEGTPVGAASGGPRIAR